jgi:4-hydroxy-3-methylbut-2-enyl diphosphate reductase
LYKVCKDQNPNTYFISGVDEIDVSWFDSNDTVGICGATSTPMWLMEEVKEKILKLNINNVA